MQYRHCDQTEEPALPAQPMCTDSLLVKGRHPGFSHSWLTALFSLALFASVLSAPASRTNLASKFALAEPCPALANAARTNQIPLGQIETPTDGDAINPGDSLTALVTFYEKNDRHMQWLLHLEAVTPDDKEQSVKPAR